MSHVSGKRACLIVKAGVVLMIALGSAHAQVDEPRPPLPVNPTPLAELLTVQERTQLSRARNPKEIVQTLLKVADTHLNMAMAEIDRDDPATAERDLDIYNKAISEAGKVAFDQTQNRRKLAKIIEQELLKHFKVLDAIQKRFPPDRIAFAEAAKDSCHRLRVRALNEAFASGDILKPPDGESDSESAPAEKAGKGPGDYRFISFHIGRSHQSTVDYMNEEENVLVREAQEIDDRIKVFMKIADRRLAAITNTPAPTDDKSKNDKSKKESEKELLKWGPVPQVSRSELLSHYSKTIDEAIAKIEDSFERNPKSTKLTHALKTFLEATETHLKLLMDLEPKLHGDAELRAVKTAIDRAKTAVEGAREGLKGR